MSIAILMCAVRDASTPICASVCTLGRCAHAVPLGFACIGAACAGTGHHSAAYEPGGVCAAYLLNTLRMDQEAHFVHEEHQRRGHAENCDCGTSSRWVIHMAAMVSLAERENI